MLASIAHQEFSVAEIASASEAFLVGGIPTPLKNMSSSVGIVKFPIYGKIIQSCSSHHQSDHHNIPIVVGL